MNLECGQSDLGLLLADRSDGPFRLEIAEIEAFRFSDEEMENDDVVRAVVALCSSVRLYRWIRTKTDMKLSVRTATDSRSARSTRSTMSNQKIPTGDISWLACPSKRIKAPHGHTAMEESLLPSLTAPNPISFSDLLFWPQ